MIPLEPTHYFHVYNHANGFEKLFLTQSNYVFFLTKCKQYLDPFVTTYCYCLMSNHVHFLVRVKSEKEIAEYLAKKDVKTGLKQLKTFTDDPEQFISKQFSNLFSSYSQAFNKQQSRMGSLFMKNIKRKPVKDEQYLKKLVHYIHHNPVQAGLCENPAGWRFSSYNAILRQSSESDKELISWFDDVAGYHAFHLLPSALNPEE